MIHYAVGIIFGLFYFATHAQWQSATGSIGALRVHDSLYQANMGWFSLEGIATLSACNTSSGGAVFKL